MEELKSFLDELDKVETYDKEIVLLDIFMELLTHEDNFPAHPLKDILIEISRWRDNSLSDGCQDYYERFDFEQKKSVIEVLENCDFPEELKELPSIYKSGLTQGAFEIIDDWIIRNQWSINDWLGVVIQNYCNFLN